MEQDKHLKDILMKGAETASEDFTDTLMTLIDRLSTQKFFYKPMVNDKVKKGFVIVYVSVVSFILLLCLVIALPELPFVSMVKIPLLPLSAAYEILAYIGSFWIVFIMKAFLEKRRNTLPGVYTK